VVAYTPRPKPVLACPRCRAARGVRAPVLVAVPDHLHLCLDHQVWLRSQPVVDVSALPDLAQAQHRHYEISMRHHLDQVRQASGVVDDILARWAARQHVLHTRWQHRSETLARSNGVRAVAWSVAQYPEYVVLLDLLTNPYWQRIAVGPRSDRPLFAATAGRRLGIPPRPRSGPSAGSRSPLGELMQISAHDLTPIALPAWMP
jgi:hypothetical protein